MMHVLEAGLSSSVYSVVRAGDRTPTTVEARRVVGVKAAARELTQEATATLAAVMNDPNNHQLPRASERPIQFSTVPIGSRRKPRRVSVDTSRDADAASRARRGRGRTLEQQPPTPGARTPRLSRLLRLAIERPSVHQCPAPCKRVRSAIAAFGLSQFPIGTRPG